MCDFFGFLCAVKLILQSNEYNGIDNILKLKINDIF